MDLLFESAVSFARSASYFAMWSLMPQDNRFTQFCFFACRRRSLLVGLAGHFTPGKKSIGQCPKTQPPTFRLDPRVRAQCSLRIETPSANGDSGHLVVFNAGYAEMQFLVLEHKSHMFSASQQLNRFHPHALR